MPRTHVTLAKSGDHRKTHKIVKESTSVLVDLTRGKIYLAS